ncbi:MAG: hypothetical protein VX939_02545 [Pseudomonadota bacterium]|nr:hypothetical protein [Pseudomonadota bacterium]
MNNVHVSLGLASLLAMMACSGAFAAGSDRSNHQVQAAASPASGSALTIAGIQASSGEDDPRILYILPWQHPTLARRPRTSLITELPALMAPADSRTLENHRQFRETLNPLVLEQHSGPGGQTVSNNP